MKRILVVDDEEDLCEILRYNLVNEGYYTEIAHSGEEAIKRSLASFDLILLDIMMGPMSGFKFAHKLRNEMNLDTLIIFLTAKGSENDILTGYSLGADDYIVKPFSINELLARIKALFRFTDIKDKNQKGIERFGEIELDHIRRRLIINDEAVELSSKEYRIINLLLENRGKIFSKEEILKEVWGENANVKNHAVNVNITKLRSRLGKYGSCLVNRTGLGYYFEF